MSCHPPKDWIVTIGSPESSASTAAPLRAECAVTRFTLLIFFIIPFNKVDTTDDDIGSSLFSFAENNTWRPFLMVVSLLRCTNVAAFMKPMSVSFFCCILFGEYLKIRMNEIEM